MKIITLQRPATCKGCGAEIPAGDKARYYSADAIYCETHQKDEQGNERPATLPKPQVGIQPPLKTAHSEPQPIFTANQIILDLSTEIGTLQAAVHYLTESVNAARDMLSTVVVLMREYKAVQNDQTNALNQPDRQPVKRGKIPPGRKD